MNKYDAAKEKLLNHGVISLPTETVMGLGVVYDDKVAYERLNYVKQRPESKPYSLMLGNPEEIEKYAYVGEREKRIIEAFLPGPLTMLMKAKDNVPLWVTYGTSVIGIRVPDNKTCQDLINEVGKPLLVPSANKSGNRPAMTPDDVRKEFSNELDYIIEASAEGGVPSTIIDCTKEEITIVRPGPISLEAIKKEMEK